MADLFVVTGATGNIGSKLAERLLANGHRVRAIGRSAERLQGLAGKGAELAVGSLDDAAFLTTAFEGATGVFAMIPPNYVAEDLREYERGVSNALAAAVTSAGVGRVVTLSSVGAHLAEGTGPIAGLHENEERFNALDGVEVLHLRPGYFMENTFFSLDVVKTAGIFGSSLAPNVPVAMIATADIAAEAARRLEAGGFGETSVVELHGERDITMTEATAIVGAAIGRPDLPYVQFPAADARAAMLAHGMSTSVVEEFLEMYDAFNSGLIRPTEARSAANTTPTTFEAFARDVFAPAYHAGESAASA